MMRVLQAVVAVIAAGFISGCAGLRGDVRSEPAQAFHVEVKGHGRPMILIPGLASSGEVWDGVVARYQDRFECHVLTLAGFAGQPSVSGPFLTTERDAILRYIDAQKLEHPVIVGHSLGGDLALMLAEAAPDKVGPLMIVDSLPALGAAFAPDATPAQLQARADQFRQMARIQTADQRAQLRMMSLRSMITDPAKVEIANRWGVRSDQETVLNAMYELTTTDLRPELARIHTPVTVIATWIGYKQMGGSHDFIASVFQSQYAHLPQAKLVIDDTSKHFVMWDDPATLDRELDSLLGAAPATASR